MIKTTYLGHMFSAGLAKTNVCPKLWKYGQVCNSQCITTDIEIKRSLAAFADWDVLGHLGLWYPVLNVHKFNGSVSLTSVSGHLLKRLLVICSFPIFNMIENTWVTGASFLLMEESSWINQYLYDILIEGAYPLWLFQLPFYFASSQNSKYLVRIHFLVVFSVNCCCHLNRTLVESVTELLVRSK